MEKTHENKTADKDFDERADLKKDVRLIELDGLEDIESVVGGMASCNKSSAR